MKNWIKKSQRLKPVMNEANTAVIELTALNEDLKPPKRHLISSVWRRFGRCLNVTLLIVMIESYQRGTSSEWPRDQFQLPVSGVGQYIMAGRGPNVLRPLRVNHNNGDKPVETADNLMIEHSSLPMHIFD